MSSHCSFAHSSFGSFQPSPSLCGSMALAVDTALRQLSLQECLCSTACLLAYYRGLNNYLCHFGGSLNNYLCHFWGVPCYKYNIIVVISIV